MSMCRQIPAPIIHITYISGKDQTPRGPQWSRTLLDATTELKIRSCHVLDSLQNSWLVLGDSSFLRCPPQEGHLSNSESFQSEPLIQG